MTICPYTPEFNPIERFFNTLKWNSSDGIERYQLLELSEYIVWHINQIAKNTFISYFQMCVTEMAEHIVKFNNLENKEIPTPKDTIPWKLKD